MLVKVEIIEKPDGRNPDRARGRILIMTPAGTSAAELDVREASFDADVVDTLPQSAYDNDGLVNLDELATVSEEKLHELMSSIRYLGEAD